MRSLGDSRLAEEVVQETFVRAWRSRELFDGTRASFRTWLFAIARNLTADAAQYRSSRPSSARERGEHPGFEGPTEAALISMQVKEALRRISEEHRRVIFEIHYRDRPYKEVAAEMGVNPATLRSRMYYALRSLRATLEKMGYSFQT